MPLLVSSYYIKYKSIRFIVFQQYNVFAFVHFHDQCSVTMLYSEQRPITTMSEESSDGNVGRSIRIIKEIGINDRFMKFAMKLSSSHFLFDFTFFCSF